MVRLVKGAYWDTEVKRAQVQGLAGYPVYTRKAQHRRLVPRVRRAHPRGARRLLRPVRHAQRAHRRARCSSAQRRARPSSSSACTAWARTSTTQVVERGQRVPRLRAGRQPRGPAAVPRAPAARERRQHVVREPHRRRRDPDRERDRRSGRASRRARSAAANPKIALPARALSRTAPIPRGFAFADEAASAPILAAIEPLARAHRSGRRRRSSAGASARAPGARRAIPRAAA